MKEDTDEWEAPRCRHGFIILGCPEDDCPEQDEYLRNVRSASAEIVRKLYELG